MNVVKQRFAAVNVLKGAVSFIRRIVVLRSQHQVFGCLDAALSGQRYVTEADHLLGRARQLEESKPQK